MQRVPKTRLAEILENEGRTQSWIARRLGVKRQQVGVWVNGAYEPVPATKKQIADLLGRTVDELWPKHEAGSDHNAPDSHELDRNAA